MPTLRFRAPALALDAEGLVALVLPGREAESLLRAGALRRARLVDGRFEPGAPLRRPRARVAPGAAYCLEAARPYEMPRLGSTAWGLMANWPWWRGTVAEEGFRWEVPAGTAHVSQLRFESLGGEPLDPVAIARWSEAAGAPLLGDLEHGGIACGGEVRLAAEASELVWPELALTVLEVPAPEAELLISAETARALRRGHPWVFPDADTGDPARFAPGALVRLRVGEQVPVALARIEAEPRLTARVWARGEAGEEDPRSIEERVVGAIRKRAALSESAGSEKGTDAFRLVHGEADGLPGLAIDRFGSALRVLVSGAAALPLRERAARVALRASGLPADAPVVEVLNFRRLPPGRTEAVRLVNGAWPDDWGPGPVVREGGLRFRTDLGLGEPDRPHPGVGFFTDQRENRERVRNRVVPGGRYANLFAHTGAFSLALLEAGAGDVVSVDLSARYLAWLDENLEHSGLAGPAHTSVRRDARQWLAEQREGARFDGLILDPPTAAASGRRFFSVQRELRALVRGLVRRLEPGGFLLVTRNEQRSREPLRSAVEQASRDVGRPLASCDPAPPAWDHPQRPAFPEGSAFEGVLAIFQ